MRACGPRKTSGAQIDLGRDPPIPAEILHAQAGLHYQPAPPGRALTSYPPPCLGNDVGLSRASAL